MLGGMNLLLPQEREAVLEALRRVDIHGDRYVDVALRFDDGTAAGGRLGAAELPAGLVAGERVRARFVMRVLVALRRSGGPAS
ncbi:MAG: hypothetical protein MUC69_11015 [Gemmatimonadales bacterium]|nr:hypothetical protein [Gemmatimonadales bacterium]